MDRRALADFLRLRREAVSPIDVGLAVAGPRRTPGLRREEVAELAHISTDHYTRVEQARGSRPSRHVLELIGNALRLTDGDSAYLLAFAEDRHPIPGSTPAVVPEHIAHLMEQMPATAAVVRDTRSDILAWTRLAAELLDAITMDSRSDRNLLLRYFLHPDPAVRYASATDESAFVLNAVAALRDTVRQYPGDERACELASTLISGSAAFARLWKRAAVPATLSGQKYLRHPRLGVLDLRYTVLSIPASTHQMVLLTADPGSETHSRMSELLRDPSTPPTRWTP